MQLKSVFIVGAVLLSSITVSASESYYVSPKGYFIGDSEHITDYQLAEGVVDFLRSEGAHSLVDFGCGDGDYVNFYREQGFDAVGYDGNPVTEEASGGTCFVMDLSVPVDLGRQFDWVHSLETGEHLPKRYERIFIENLLRHVKGGLILSWAYQGQGGIGHFNERNNGYIKKVLDELGVV